VKQRNDLIGELLAQSRTHGAARRQIGIGIAAAVLATAAYTSVCTVQPEERAVIKRFGAVFAIADPGLHFKLPFGIDHVQLVATERVLEEEFGFRTAPPTASRAHASSNAISR
jgi:membrane protease subunit HflK